MVDHLRSFDGAAIPIGQLGGQARLVEKVQQALSKLGYLDPPPDGRWGPVSNWGLERVLRDQWPFARQGFTRDIARALINPTQVLPDVKPRGDWFDKVIAYMNRNGYWICRHARGSNIVYLEGLDCERQVNDDRPNVFNDLRVAFTIDESGQARMPELGGDDRARHILDDEPDESRRRGADCLRAVQGLGRGDAS